MTKPPRKNAATKPAPTPVIEAEEHTVPAPEVVPEHAIEPDDAPVEDAPAPVEDDDADEPASDEVALPLIDGVDPEWAVSASVGSRHIEFTAGPLVAPADLSDVLSAKTVTLPGGRPIEIASRVLTPVTLRPVRVTFTVREPIAG